MLLLATLVVSRVPLALGLRAAVVVLLVSMVDVEVEVEDFKDGRDRPCGEACLRSFGRALSGSMWV